MEVLTGGGHDGKSYSITGPEAVTVYDVASAISDAVGREVSYVNIPEETAKDAFMAMGIDEWTVDQYLKYYEAFRNNHATVVYDDFTKLTGRQPRTIRDFAGDFAHVFKPELATAGT